MWYWLAGIVAALGLGFCLGWLVSGFTFIAAMSPLADE